MPAARRTRATPQPWDGEPERGDGWCADLRWEARRVVMHKGHWYWAGFVYVPFGHPLESSLERDESPDVVGHYNVIWTRRDDEWSVWFDCGHSGDRSALDPSEGAGPTPDVFRPFAYVRAAIGSIVAQCILAAPALFGAEAEATAALREATGPLESLALVVRRSGDGYLAQDLSADDGWRHELPDLSAAEIAEAAENFKPIAVARAFGRPDPRRLRRP